MSRKASTTPKSPTPCMHAERRGKRLVLVGNDPTAVLAAASCGVASGERLSPQVKAR